VKRYRAWPGILGWLLALGFGLALWFGIHELWGGIVVIGILAFGLCALAVAGESMHEQAKHGSGKDDDRWS
jgi:hypothetical protein